MHISMYPFLLELIGNDVPPLIFSVLHSIFLKIHASEVLLKEISPCSHTLSHVVFLYFGKVLCCCGMVIHRLWTSSSCWGCSGWIFIFLCFSYKEVTLVVLTKGLWCIMGLDVECVRGAKQDCVGIQIVNSLLFGTVTK